MIIQAETVIAARNLLKETLELLKHTGRAKEEWFEGCDSEPYGNGARFAGTVCHCFGTGLVFNGLGVGVAGVTANEVDDALTAWCSIQGIDTHEREWLALRALKLADVTQVIRFNDDSTDEAFEAQLDEADQWLQEIGNRITEGETLTYEGIGR